MEGFNKINATHLSRTGYVYIRQSTAYQVTSNTESTLRQYALKDRLLALGWDQSKIEIIDADLGISGKEVDNREGFMKLMADTANGKAGAIACIEASRLSRSSSDWTRLIEICCMTNTLLIDTDGIYNPNDFNDRLLLGLKGTMSEAELHFLTERMKGGLVNKAKRGELRRYLPIGYDYDLNGNVVKTSDIAVRQAVEQLFDIFRREKTAISVVKYYHRNDLKFPVRSRLKGQYLEVSWQPLNRSRVVAILHNPFYTGTYIFGRTQMRWTPSGKRRPVPVPEEEWHANIFNHHESYISEEEFQLNQSILQENCQKWGESEKKGSPREGNTLLQGICYCGFCGHRMIPMYSRIQSGETKAHYRCSGKLRDSEIEECRQSLPADIIDQVISDVVIEKLAPEALSVTAQVQEEVERRGKEHLKYFEIQVEKAKYESDSARVRYMSVDASNRLVALSLETDWNEKLRNYEEAVERYNTEKSRITLSLKEQLDKAAASIGDNFMMVWKSPDTRNEDKKRIVRYLIRDVTLQRTDFYTVKIQICFQGGAILEKEAPVPKPRYVMIATPKSALEFMEEHAETCTFGELASKLNESGLIRTCGRPFTRKNVHRIMNSYGIKNKKQRYLERNWITVKEAAEKLGLPHYFIRHQIKSGKYSGNWERVEDNGLILLDPNTLPVKEELNYIPKKQRK